MSDSVRPHGLQPTRLLRPWDFPGNSTGVGCHCLLQFTKKLKKHMGEMGKKGQSFSELQNNFKRPNKCVIRITKRAELWEDKYIRETNRQNISKSDEIHKHTDLSQKTEIIKT